jgi:hypothetical protein
MTEARGLLERVWEHREAAIYRQLFGDTGPGIYPLSAEIFSKTFQKSCDPRWLTVGVFECPPIANRNTWAYVSSGLSNPWEEELPLGDPSELSGLGVEYVFNTTAQADWAIQLVQYVAAYDLLLNHGAFPDREVISPGDRIPVQVRDRSDRLSLIQRVMVLKPEFMPACHRLESGDFYFLQLVGITEAESDLARASDTSTLCDRLRTAGALDVTDPWRLSLV